MTDITVNELLDEWWNFKRGGFEPTTRKTTQSIVKKLKARFGDIGADSLKARHLDAWYAELRERYSVKYIRRVAGVLEAAYSCGQRWEVVLSNPVAISQKPKDGTAKVKMPTNGAVKTALAEDMPLWLFAFVRLVSATGARRSELLGLRRADLDADLGTITIRRVCVCGDNGNEVLDRAKSARGARTIAIDAETVKVLEKYLLTHESEWLFPGIGDLPISPDYVTERIKRLGVDIGERLHPHAFRHWSITSALMAGIPLPIVAARAGDSIGTIVNVYSHAVPGLDKGAADAIAGLLDD